ncbi:MAG: VWA domain-containing protein [Xanthomonadales bacterium]|jgi:Ca-activated chloride channel family protein|nr:VWA domain-containing protein [Xanthomonadales bacterium]
MSQNNTPITLTARWDHDQVPVGKNATRGLLIEVEAAKLPVEAGHERPPVNIALVIDRSGSMQGEPLFAAIEAAVGVTEQLGPADRLSVVAYDHAVDVLVDGKAMDAEGRRKAELAIRSLRTGGTTALADGWLQGARCAARVMDDERNKGAFQAGHVVLLTDGCANRGETDPDKLADLAANLAERGVTSTCVGIGAHYSALQVTAIAEAGQGELHQSTEPSEIIEVLSGEIGEQTQIVARNFSLHVKGTNLHQARQLTRYRKMPVNGRREYFLGNLVSGQKRQLALLVEFEPRENPHTEDFLASASWLDPETALEEQQVTCPFTLDFVAPADFDPAGRDEAVAETIATLWLARQGYEAMMHNERGDFAAASHSVESNRDLFDDLVADLDIAAELQHSRDTVQERVTRQWDGVSKKEAMLLARKRMRAKPDFRAAHEGREWTDVDSE